MTVETAFFHFFSVSCLVGLVNQVQSKEYDFDKNHNSCTNFGNFDHSATERYNRLDENERPDQGAD